MQTIQVAFGCLYGRKLLFALIFSKDHTSI
jgi:hypothetical protein